ncbi:hypothetical protein LCGC14_2256710, partial [marine sediment metagenome]
AMRTSALEFYHSLVKNYTAIFEEFEGYEMEAVAMDKRFDVLMVGYSLKFDIKQLAGFGTVSVVGTLVNSEGTTINTLSPNETKTQPDITVTAQDDTTSGYPSDKDLDVDDFLTGITTWAGLVSATKQGYAYPAPPLQSTSYQTNDAAQVESLYYGSTVRDANELSAINSLSAWDTLRNTNSWGNTSRFTNESGTSASLPIDTSGGAVYLLDNLTGVGYYFEQNYHNSNLAIWNTQIDWATNLTAKTFSDYFIPPVEFVSTLFAGSDIGQNGNLSQIFEANASQYIWLSTTRNNTAVAYAINVRTDSFTIWPQTKSGSWARFAARRHF